MVNPLRQITESDLMVINAKIEGVEKGLALQQSHAMDVLTKMAVFESNQKRSDDDIRRIGENHEKSIGVLKTTMENNYNSIFGKLESIIDALGLDGTPASDKRLRHSIEKLNRDNARHEQDWGELRKTLISWSAKCIIAFILGAVIWRLGLNIKIPGNL